MRILLGLLSIIAGLVLLAALLFWSATSDAPEVRAVGSIHMADLERGRAVLSQLRRHHPKDGEALTFVLSEREIGHALNFMLNRAVGGAAAVQVMPGALTVVASARIPKVSRYLNLQLDCVDWDGQVVPDTLRVGSLSLPAGPVLTLIDTLAPLSRHGAYWRIARDMVHSARIDQNRLMLNVVWHGDALRETLERGMGVQGEALDAYRLRLAELQRTDALGMIRALFALAEQRSEANDPVHENRAALIALAEVVQRERLAVGGEAPVARPKGVDLRILGRYDFVQHLSFSAFIAAMGDEGLADMAGLYKELKDARQGSGFSFTDLAADRAGSALGEAATRSPEDARRVQRALARAESVAVFMPAVDGLPEFMAQPEFIRRFGGVGAPAYLDMIRTIEARIRDLPLFRAP